MPSGSSNQPKLLKGAFIDSNLLSVPPLVVPFQFNPEKMTRRKTVYVRIPKSRAGREERVPASESMGEAQSTITSPEILTFDIRLDASDAMEKGDRIAGEFGVLPALSALEMMIVPRSDRSSPGCWDFPRISALASG